MAKGKKFEAMIRDTAKEFNLFYLRLQDSLKFSRSEGARFAPRSPYDGVLYMNGKIYCLELKNIKGTSLSVGEDKTIKKHQVEELTKASAYEGVHGAFLILFEERETKRTKREETLIYLPIEAFNRIREENPDRKSLSYEDCIRSGYRIEKVRVGVRKMRYDLTFIEKCH